MEPTEDLGKKRPGAIQCNGILDNPNKYFLKRNDDPWKINPLKSNLKNGEDFITLAAGCGKMLHSIFGGDQIIRKNSKKYFDPPITDVYPFTVLTYFK